MFTGGSLMNESWFFFNFQAPYWAAILNFRFLPHNILKYLEKQIVKISTIFVWVSKFWWKSWSICVPHINCFRTITCSSLCYWAFLEYFVFMETNALMKSLSVKIHKDQLIFCRLRVPLCLSVMNKFQKILYIHM